MSDTRPSGLWMYRWTTAGGPVDNRSPSVHNGSPSVEIAVDPGSRRNQCPKALVGVAAGALEISSRHRQRGPPRRRLRDVGSGGKPQRPAGSRAPRTGSEVRTGERSSARTPGRATRRPAEQSVGIGRGTTCQEARRPSNRTVSGPGTAARGAPTERSDGKRTGREVRRSAPTERSDGERTTHRRGAARRPSNRTESGRHARRAARPAERSVGERVRRTVR